jgi:hypothetical protein
VICPLDLAVSFWKRAFDSKRTKQQYFYSQTQWIVFIFFSQ